MLPPIFRAVVLLVLGLAAFSECAWAKTFYVDFEAGDDARGGTEQNPWKHAPGDSAATGGPASTALQPGDTIQFRGGVVYRGAIVVPASGEPDAPISYLGTGWGEGRAILDGSDLITGWEKCASAADALGSENFSNLYMAEITVDSPFLLNMHELQPQSLDDEFLDMAQDPNPQDAFFFDRRDSFHPVTHDNLTSASVCSPEVFTQPDADHWKGASLLVWVNPNFTKRFAIVSYEPSESRVTVEDMGENAIYSDGRDQAFAIFNSAHVIDQPGEFAVGLPDAEGKRKIVLWPRSPENLDTRISRSTRKNGFDLSGRSHVMVDGFVIRKFAGEAQEAGSGIVSKDRGTGGSQEVVIRNNVVTHNMSGSRGYGGIFLSGARDGLVENNEVTWNRGHRGIFVSGSENVIIRKNHIAHPGATALGIYGGKRLQILDNDLTKIFGTHANGITIYIASENVLVAGNRITEATTPITFQDSGPLYFINNVADGGDKYRNVNEWGNTKRGPWASGQIVFLNNTFVNAEKEGSLNLGKDPEKTYVIVNNILDGLNTDTKKSAKVVHNHNIFTGLSSFQASRYGWQMEKGESEQELANLFVDPEKHNFRLRPGGPAIGTGANVSAYYPKDIFPDVDFDQLAGVTKPMNIGASSATENR